MRSLEGKDYWNTGFYREIVVPERLVITDSFADESGNIVPASYYGMSKDFPLEMLVTVTFEEPSSETRMTLQYVGIPQGADSEVEQGWRQSFDKLDEYLEK